MTSSKYIISLPGIPSPSSSNSNVINITNTSGDPIPSNVSVDLSMLDDVVGVGCEFDVYIAYDGLPPDEINQFCQLPDDCICCNEVSFPDNFLCNDGSGSNSNASNTTAIFVPATGNGAGINAPHCSFLVNDLECNTLSFWDVLLDANNNSITATSGSTTIYKTNSTTITCGTNLSINLNHPSFDAEFENSCSNPDQSFLVLTPKSGVTGAQSIGASTNSDGSNNIGFNINNVNNQNRQFYLNINCAKDSNNKDIMEIVLNDVIIG